MVMIMMTTAAIAPIVLSAIIVPVLVTSVSVCAADQILLDKN